MVGISLSPALFDPDCDGVWKKILENVGSVDAVLKRLWREGARSIEIRSVDPKTDPQRVEHIVGILLDAGFHVSIHSKFKSAETAVADVFNPITDVLAKGLLKSVNLTIHALPDTKETVSALLKLSDRAGKESCRITFALENNRRFPDKSDGDCSELILKIVEKVDRPNVGICWDFGHLWYNVRKYSGGDRRFLPSEDFLKRTVHTHIHTSRDGDLKTHFPPDEKSMPLKEWMAALSYTGIYNAEPDPKRWTGDPAPEESLFACVRNIADAVPLRSAMIERLTGKGRTVIEGATGVFSQERDGYSLICPSGYLLKLGGTSFGMDLAYSRGVSGEWKTDIADLLSDLRFVLLTHAHKDHLSKAFLGQLADKDIKWIVPDFISVPMLPEENIIRVSAGDTVEINGIRITSFAGHHYRPITKSGVPELGYLVEGHGKRLLFPGDIRDYDFRAFPDYRDIDILFAHLWTGDKKAQVCGVTPQALAYARFVASYAPKTVCITHLFETGRTDESIWSYRAAGIAADEILRRVPDTDILIPRFGIPYEI